eukprot:8988570-Ditylum_brightwellii.AAC.1
MNKYQLTYGAAPKAVVRTYLRLYSMVVRKKQHWNSNPALKYARRSFGVAIPAAKICSLKVKGFEAFMMLSIMEKKLSE